MERNRENEPVREFGVLIDMETCRELSEMLRESPDDFMEIMGVFLGWVAAGAADEQAALENVARTLPRLYLSRLVSAHIRRRMAYDRRHARYKKERAKEDGQEQKTPCPDESALNAPVSLEQAKSHAEIHFNAPRPTPEWVESWYARMAERGWRDTKGNPLTRGRWQAVMSAWWRQENKAKSNGTSGVTGGFADTSTMNYND